MDLPCPKPDRRAMALERRNGLALDRPRNLSLPLPQFQRKLALFLRSTRRIQVILRLRSQRMDHREGRSINLTRPDQDKGIFQEDFFGRCHLVFKINLSPLFCVLFLSSSFLCHSFAQKGKVAPPIKGAEHLVYKEASGSKLILNAFYPKGHNAQKDKRPAIVFFFGGGWSGGNPAQFAPTANTWPRVEWSR